MKTLHLFNYNAFLLHLSVLLILVISCIAQDSQSPPVEPTETLGSDALRKKGDDLMKDNKVSQAIHFYTQAIDQGNQEKDNNNQYLNYYKRAIAYLLQSNNLKALADLNIVIEKKPNYLQVW